jgi:hypothetical protein
MAFQGEYFLARYGKRMAAQAPPVASMLELGLPVGAGTDATRISSYNPWVSLYWLVSGKTVGGTPLYPEANRLDRMKALGLYTKGSAWFSGEEGKKGTIKAGEFADLAVLNQDYFSVPEERIKQIESVLTVVDGKPVYAAGQFQHLAPPPLPVSPSWSPVAVYGGYPHAAAHFSGNCPECAQANAHPAHTHRWVLSDLGLWQMGCDCFAF